MSRSRRGGQGSAFSLFPFLAVLLCTMGAMVVLLVTMAYVARQRAQREAEAIAAAEVTPASEAAQQRLAEATAYRDRLGEIRSDAAERLREEQTRLSGIEDHIRRLRDEVEALQAEAAELLAMEEEHYEDRKAADEELARQRELIQQLNDEIAQLEEEAISRQRRYAVVPLRDRETGTHRPPIYFECRADGVVLQPEGLVIRPEDFRSPIEMSSPLAAALRAVNQYYTDHPDARAANEAGAPYALLLVRPDGVENFKLAQNVLESIDMDYGYQPVAEDWPLEYEAPKPDLLGRVSLAINVARAERQRLAAVAPQLFRPQGIKGRARWGGSQADAAPNERGHGKGGEAPGVQDGGFNFAGVATEGAETRAGRAGQRGDPGVAQTPVGSAGEGSPGELVAHTGPTDEAASASTSGAANSGSDESRGGAAGGDSTAGAAAQTPANGGQPQQGSLPRTLTESLSREAAKLDRRDGIAMRRPIGLAVFADRIVVLPEGIHSIQDAAAARYGETIRLEGPKREQSKQIIEALRLRTRSWGFAGSGTYWKPTLQFSVAPDAQAVAEELAVAFSRAGLDVNGVNKTASNGGGTGETRR